MSRPTFDADAFAAAPRPAYSHLRPLVSSAALHVFSSNPVASSFEPRNHDSLCPCRHKHLIPTPLSRHPQVPSHLRDCSTDLGFSLYRHRRKRLGGPSTVPPVSSKRESDTPLSSWSSPQIYTEQGRAAEDLEFDLWQLQEPLGASAGSGSRDRRDDIDKALLYGASSSADPFQEQTDDPALADRRVRSLGASASTSGRASAASAGIHYSNSYPPELQFYSLGCCLDICSGCSGRLSRNAHVS